MGDRPYMGGDPSPFQQILLLCAAAIGVGCMENVKARECSA